VMQFYGWSIEQWAWAARFHCAVGGTLPDLADSDACIGVMDAWVERFNVSPEQPEVLLTNYLGQVFKQDLPFTYRKWAAQFVLKEIKGLRQPRYQPPEFFGSAK
jgi:hypothetical protein